MAQAAAKRCSKGKTSAPLSSWGARLGLGGEGGLWSPADLWRHSATRGLASMLLAGAAVALAGWGLQRHAAQDQAFQVSIADAELSQDALDEWVGGAWQERLGENIGAELRAALGEGEIYRLLDDAMVGALAERSRQCAWVQSVERLERVFPNRIRASFIIRRPFAAVPDEQGGYHLVDAGGTLLPLHVDDDGMLATLNGDLVTPLATVIGAVGSPPATPGTRWPDEALHAALDLEEGLRRHGFYSLASIQALRVDHFRADAPGDRYLALEVQAGERRVEVRWGNPPSAPGYREPSPEKKHQGLARILQENEVLTGVRYVDLRFDEPIVATENATSGVSGW